MAKTACPSCGAELDIPDDPRVTELMDLVNKQGAVIERMSEKLEAAGIKPPAAPEVPSEPRERGSIFDWGE